MHTDTEVVRVFFARLLIFTHIPCSESNLILKDDRVLKTFQKAYAAFLPFLGEFIQCSCNKTSTEAVQCSSSVKFFVTHPTPHTFLVPQRRGARYSARVVYATRCYNLSNRDCHRKCTPGEREFLYRDHLSVLAV